MIIFVGERKKILFFNLVNFRYDYHSFKKLKILKWTFVLTLTCSCSGGQGADSWNRGSIAGAHYSCCCTQGDLNKRKQKGEAKINLQAKKFYLTITSRAHNFFKIK
jgi:hypothetical protein